VYKECRGDVGMVGETYIRVARGLLGKAREGERRTGREGEGGRERGGRTGETSSSSVERRFRGQHSLKWRDDLDAGEPRIANNLLSRRPRLRIRIEHPPEDTPTLARDEVRERGRGRAGGAVELEVRAEGGVGGFCNSPGEFLEMHAVEDDGRGPDVDEAGVVLCERERRSSVSFKKERRRENRRNAPLCSNCSGAMYGSLPHNPFERCVVFSQHILNTSLTPKSVILTCPFASRRRFSGLMSR
jgi:hypothetical protein